MAHGLSDADIKTHYVSLNDVRFPFAKSFTMDEIPELRMDVMLEPNEGALVFYEGLIDDDNEEEPLYIQPLATPGHKVNERRRLRYQFDIIPRQELIEDPGACTSI